MTVWLGGCGKMRPLHAKVRDDTGRGDSSRATPVQEVPVKERLETIIVEMVEKGIRLELAARDFEHKYLKIALDLHQGNRLATARALGIHRNTLSNKLFKHCLR